MVAVRNTRTSSATIQGFANVNDYGAVQGSGNSSTAVTNAQASLASGGILYFPPGRTYVNLSSLNVPANVHWRGAGKGASIISWTTDRGAGTRGLVCSGDNTSPVSFENLTLEGPGNVPGPGVKPCNMSGVQFGMKTWMRNCIVRNWNVGVRVNADHNLFDNCTFTNCYWGNEYPESGWDAKGDQSYRYCDFTGCNLAGIHVAGSQTLDHVSLFHTHFGFGPFGILREDYANGTTADAGFMLNVSFHGGAFEYIGNEAIADLSAGAVPGGLPSWYFCTIDNAGFTDNATFRTSINDVHGNPYPHNYAIDLPGICNGGYIRNNYYGFSDEALGTFNCNGIPIIGFGSNVPSKMFPGSQQVVLDDDDTRYESYHSSGTIAAGDLVELSTTSYTVQRASGVIGTKPVIGVAVTGTSSGEVVLIARRYAPRGFLINTSDSIGTSGLLLVQKTGTYHQICPSTTSGSTSNPVVGYSITPTSSGQTRATLNLAV